jgi:hypothetical protein
MGQEASVLADGRGGGDGIDASLEEQARAPPSAVNPSSAASSSVPTNLSPTRDHGKPRKLITGIPSMFQRGLIGSNKDPPHSHDTESFEQREAARAAAAGGNLYYGPSPSESFLDESEVMVGYSTLQKLPSQNAASEHHQALQTSASMFSMGGHDAAAATADTSVDPVARTTATPDKKSIFSGRASARGMINSMRNLSIGNALQRKTKEVNDWEKQWDEDDDDSDDGQQDAAASGRPIEGQYKTNAIPPPPPPLPPSNHSLLVGSATAGTAPKSPIRHDNLYYATPPPPPPPPSLSAVDLLSSTTAPPLSAAPSLVTPPPPQYPYVTQPHQQHASGGLDVWETDASLPQPHAYDVRKPDVDMFLPVLRVLGKGSFGKVRAVFCRPIGQW